MVITDSDALIGLAYDGDILHERSVRIYQYLKEQSVDTFTPYPIILESATVLARVLNHRDLALKFLEDYQPIEYAINTDVFELVAKLYNAQALHKLAIVFASEYNPKTSKKNTPFDHYVLALAKKNNIQYVFSFDSFYKKNGLTLMEDLVK